MHEHIELLRSYALKCLQVRMLFFALYGSWPLARVDLPKVFCKNVILTGPELITFQAE
jgi:hypothetical protein